MSNCKLDHSLEDVKSKLYSQKEFLPEELFYKTENFLEKSPNQTELNEIFHLLKKYDLVSDSEKSERNHVLNTILK
ncbi:group-specific protein [Bacillus pinisoli]|uniref:group-specific protein n=1 Tax=Bacillus pinisoli TaxID=2901866 RepID=UPI001FF29954|nr:group-specific protein [Bacillus pinisoli]